MAASRARSPQRLLAAVLACGLGVGLVLFRCGTPAIAQVATPAPTFGPIPLVTPGAPGPIPPPAASPTGAAPVAPEAPEDLPAITPGPSPTLPAWADAQVLGPAGGELRTGVGTDYHSLGHMPPGTPLLLAGRDANMTWFQVISADQRIGWVEAQHLVIHRTDLTSLPLGWVEPDPNASIAASDAPGLSPEVIARAKEIYAHGQRLGNNPNSVLLVGDSVNEEGRFLKAFAEGNYDLGAFTYLQPTIDAYYAAGAFAATYLTEHTGLTYPMILDPLFANPELCFPGESVLDCEYRLKRPSIAIIYLGLNDMRFFPPEEYARNMERVMQSLIGYGVVPVLTTFTIANEYEYAGPTPEYLAVMRQVAASLDIPLIDYHRAAATLPHRGTGEDGAHLTFPAGHRIAFTGDQYLYGTTLRELLTLQTLHELRVNAFGM